MNLADIIYEQVKTMPEPLVREVLDFIGFLQEKSERASWQDLMMAQEETLAHVWNDPEDEGW